MNLILNVLFWILIVILVLILIILYILLSKRSFFIEYTKDDGVIIEVKILFLKFKIYKSKKNITIKKEDIKKETQNTASKKIETKETKTKETKIEKEAKDKKTIKKAQEKNKVSKKEKSEKSKDKTNLKDELFKDLSFSEIFSIIKDAVNSINGFISVLARKIKFEKISFTLPIHSQDPLKTQKMYGAITSSFYLLSTALQSKFFISYENPVFVADFENMLEGKEYFYIKITARTGFLMAVLLYLLKEYLYYKKTYLNNKDVKKDA